MSIKDIDVLVVGAGPVGLFCANELIRHGLSCRIIEKKSELGDKSKALGIHIRTLDVLQDGGFLNAVMQQGHVVRSALLKSNGKQLAEVSFKHLGATRDFLIDLPQDQTERIFYQALMDKKVMVEWHSELLSIEQHVNDVIASIKRHDGIGEQIRTRWIIACDGAHSTLRHLVNAEFVGASYPESWWLADLHINWALPEDKMIIHVSEKGPLACFPMGQHRYRLVLTAPDKTPTPTLDDIIKAFNERSSDQAILSDPVWITAFSIHHRQLQQYRHNRVFFCGDAAHIHSPMGGQGLNTGIQDSYNLVWKLALVQKGQAEESLLNSYHEERYPIGKGVLKKTDVMTKMMLLTNPYLIAARNQVIRFLTRFSYLRKALATDLAELKINYATSSIVKGLGQKTRFKLGEFIPNALLSSLATREKKTLSEICQGTQHHLFLFAGKEEGNTQELEKTAEQLSKQFSTVLTVHLVRMISTPAVHCSSLWIDVQHIFHDRFGLNHSTAMLVRPDKYIGLVQSPIHLMELRTALLQQFIV